MVEICVVMKKWMCVLPCIVFLLVCCKNTQKEKITKLVNEWQGREIIFPKNPVFTVFAKDTVSYSFADAEYKVMVYVDSIGCTSCKLQLPRWKQFIHELDSVADKQVPVLFFVHPKKVKDIQHTLRLDRFDHPVSIDIDDEINTLNKFPSDMTFQSFLLDKENKVKVIGNPVHNYVVKNLYFKQITGKEDESGKQLKTTAEAEQTAIDFGKFDVKEKKTATFLIKNTGQNPLVILDVNTTCGCTAATYDKKPASPGNTLKIQVEMTPKDTGFFEETVTVRCNTSSPMKLTIKGQATD